MSTTCGRSGQNAVGRHRAHRGRGPFNIRRSVSGCTEASPPNPSPESSTCHVHIRSQILIAMTAVGRHRAHRGRGRGPRRCLRGRDGDRTIGAAVGVWRTCWGVGLGGDVLSAVGGHAREEGGQCPRPRWRQNRRRRYRCCCGISCDSEVGTSPAH